MRLVVLNAADMMDIRGNKAGKYVIAQSKILVPKKVAEIVDECMQMYAGQGLTQHTSLPEIWTYARFVRVADGPDAAHRHQVGRDQLKLFETTRRRHQEYADRARELRKHWGIEGEEDEFEWDTCHLGRSSCDSGARRMNQFIKHNYGVRALHAMLSREARLLHNTLRLLTCHASSRCTIGGPPRIPPSTTRQ